MTRVVVRRGRGCHAAACAIYGRWSLAVDAQLQADGGYAVAVPGAGVYRVRYGGDVAGPGVRVR